MKNLDADGTSQRSGPWRGAAVLAAGYAVFYMPLAYFIGRPISLRWLIWPALAVAGATFIADRKGIGDRPWFVRTMTLLIVVVAIVGTLLS
ncbi:hypothetical protein ACIPYS_09620 [Kitasatospora sp. NPDC089913]|uniref:hypothetical protein n=1 Tax=Kitasatospora sp. NPDC089913 TaxID=3364080 RepID=UPI0037F32F5C